MKRELTRRTPPPPTGEGAEGEGEASGAPPALPRRPRSESADDTLTSAARLEPELELVSAALPPAVPLGEVRRHEFEGERDRAATAAAANAERAAAAGGGGGAFASLRETTGAALAGGGGRAIDGGAGGEGGGGGGEEAGAEAAEAEEGFGGVGGAGVAGKEGAEEQGEGGAAAAAAASSSAAAAPGVAGDGSPSPPSLVAASVAVVVRSTRLSLAAATARRAEEAEEAFSAFAAVPAAFADAGGGGGADAPGLGGPSKSSSSIVSDEERLPPEEAREERGEVGVASVEGGVPGGSQSLLDEGEDRGEAGAKGGDEGEGEGEAAAGAAAAAGVEAPLAGEAEEQAFAFAGPSRPSPPPVAGGSSAADSRGTGLDRLPGASGAAGGAGEARDGPARALSEPGVARPARVLSLLLLADAGAAASGGAVDSPAPRSRAAASSISPNKKFHRDAMIPRSVDSRSVGRGRKERESGEAILTSSSTQRGTNSFARRCLFSDGALRNLASNSPSSADLFGLINECLRGRAPVLEGASSFSTRGNAAAIRKLMARFGGQPRWHGPPSCSRGEKFIVKGSVMFFPCESRPRPKGRANKKKGGGTLHSLAADLSPRILG